MTRCKWCRVTGHAYNDFRNTALTCDKLIIISFSHFSFVLMLMLRQKWKTAYHSQSSSSHANFEWKKELVYKTISNSQHMINRKAKFHTNGIYVYDLLFTTIAKVHRCEMKSRFWIIDMTFSSFELISNLNRIMMLDFIETYELYRWGNESFWLEKNLPVNLMLYSERFMISSYEIERKLCLLVTTYSSYLLIALHFLCQVLLTVISIQWKA